MWEGSYLREFCAQVSQIVLLADLTVLQIITTVREKNFTKLISPLVLCTSLPNRVLSWFDRFTSYYKYMKESVTKLISARLLCTSVTNRVHCWFDQFTANYNCMKKNVTKLISPRVLCTSITKRVLSWFDRSTASSNCLNKNVRKFIFMRVPCTSVNNSVSWFDHFTTYYYCKSNLCTVCHKSRPCLIWPFYGLIQLYERKCRKIHISTSCVHK